MRILFLSSSASLGGSERSLLDVIAAVHEAEPSWSLHLLVPDDGPIVAKAEALGASIVVLPFPPFLERLGSAWAVAPAGRRAKRKLIDVRLGLALPRLTPYGLELRRVLRRIRPDLVHANGSKMQALAGLFAPRRTPLVWHLHDFLGERPVVSKLLRMVQGHCDALVTNSSSLAADAARVLDRRPIRHCVLQNGIDVDYFRPDGPALDLDRVAGLPSTGGAKPVRVGLFATFARSKGHEVFLRALAAMPPTIAVRGYVIGGPGSETTASQYSLEELRSLARELGLADRVGFTGGLEERAAALRRLDIVVHASTGPEPFGLVIAEAMACGKPVITTASGAAVELVDLGTNAVAYPPGDVDALSGRIAELAMDAGLRQRLGAAARETAVRRFDRRRLGREIVPLYRQLTRDRKSHRSGPPKIGRLPKTAEVSELTHDHPIPH